jgi:hypothetical protein
MSIRSLLLSFATDNSVSLDESADALHSEIDNTVNEYKRECEVFADACESVIAENPSVTKESLSPMAAMFLTKNSPAAFPDTLRAVTEYVNLAYVGKRGRRKAGDDSVRLAKRA